MDELARESAKLMGVSAMSNRYLVLVLTEPTECNEARFNEYYEHTHLDEVIESTGWKSAQRFKLAGEVGEACPLPYLAAYEAEGKSAQAVIDRLNKTRSEHAVSYTHLTLPTKRIV